jgi:hypothetical protein
MGMTGETLAGYVMRNAQNEIVRAPWCWTQADADLRTPGEVTTSGRTLRRIVGLRCTFTLKERRNEAV